MPVETLGDGPNEPDPKGLPEGLHTFLTTTENHTPDRIPENTSENASGDPVMQFVTQRPSMIFHGNYENEHKLPELAWCRFLPQHLKAGTFCKILYDNLSPDHKSLSRAKR
ncbi:hypothetical protein Tco_0892021 [Tanacetum coccineum]|uniref:Uncharacterized protein n=1 Tax=Tanacetum coccineum TaxID=301880 RepID=A0ABQ5C6B3_9ASTR